MTSWHIITGEYPPTPGGVSDYTFAVANALASAGDVVDVWCPGPAPGTPAPGHPGTRVTVHADAGSWQNSDLRRIDAALDRMPRPKRLLVQWVPHAFGRRSMNVSFCRWIRSRARRGDTLDLMVHEPGLGFGEGSLTHNLAAAAHRVMLTILLSQARRVWVAIPAWADTLKPWALGRKNLEFCWLPIPSTIPVAQLNGATARLKQQTLSGPDGIIVGHFSTYPSDVCQALREMLPGLLASLPQLQVQLLGRGGEEAARELRSAGLDTTRIKASGDLSPSNLSSHLQICDLMIQPYSDGASTRRTTLMAALAHGLPVVTNVGRLSEDFWKTSDAISVTPAGDLNALGRAVSDLVRDPARRSRLSTAARATYEARFSLPHTVDTLRRGQTGVRPGSDRGQTPLRPRSDPRPAQRLRIAFVVHDYNRVLGHSRYVAELAERFAGAHDVHVFANRFDGLPAGIVQHRVPALRMSALATIFSFPLPASMMVGRGFDIVHAQGLTVFSPDIVTAHISNARWREGRRLLEGDRLSWRERLFAALVIPAERSCLRDDRATAIAISSALRRDLAENYGRRAETVVIPHGVDQAQFHPGVRTRFRPAVRRELGLDDDTPLFLYVGDFRKGWDVAIRALVNVPGAHLLGVSRTPQEPYRTLAAAHNVAGRVTMVPVTGEIERYYGAADALVLPTPYDAFGMVITEAMACGLPVITTPMAGAAELLTHGEHGLLVTSPTDIPALSAAMSALATDRPARERMGLAAARLMREHTWDRVADRTLAVYYDHVARRQARH
ncbi:hypothetical protein BH18ACI5_BH18ACI5_24560 [soil metagenome]